MPTITYMIELWVVLVFSFIYTPVDRILKKAVFYKSNNFQAGLT